MGLVEVIIVWACAMMIIIVLGQGTKAIREYERKQRQMYWNRHTDIAISVRLAGIPTNAEGNEAYNIAQELHEEKNRKYREFQAGQKDRDLKKALLFLLMFCDVVAAFALFFYYL